MLNRPKSTMFNDSSDTVINHNLDDFRSRSVPNILGSANADDSLPSPFLKNPDNPNKVLMPVTQSEFITCPDISNNFTTSVPISNTSFKTNQELNYIQPTSNPYSVNMQNFPGHFTHSAAETTIPATT